MSSKSPKNTESKDKTNQMVDELPKSSDESKVVKDTANKSSDNKTSSKDKEPQKSGQSSPKKNKSATSSSSSGISKQKPKVLIVTPQPSTSGHSSIEKSPDSSPKNKPTPESTPPIRTRHESASPRRTRRSLNPFKDFRRFIKILDNYVSGQHWHLGFEYILHSLTATFWSLLVPFFVLYDISDKCRQRQSFLMIASVVITSMTAIELFVVIIVWYATYIYQFVNRSTISFVVLCLHISLGVINLLMSIIGFASDHCYQMSGSDPVWQDKHFQYYYHWQLQWSVPLKYDIKTIAIIESMVAINVFACAMFVAVKRNDFKFYVLWRKGLLHQYLMLDDD